MSDNCVCKKHLATNPMGSSIYVLRHGCPGIPSLSGSTWMIGRKWDQFIRHIVDILSSCAQYVYNILQKPRGTFSRDSPSAYGEETPPCGLATFHPTLPWWMVTFKLLYIIYMFLCCFCFVLFVAFCLCFVTFLLCYFWFLFLFCCFFFRFALGAWSMALVLWQPHLSIIIFWVFCFGHLLNLKKFATSCKYTHAQMWKGG